MLTLADITDARQAQGERNDCTVVALSIAACIPYDEAHAILAAGGRKFRKGMYFTKWISSQCMYTLHDKGYTVGGYRVRVVDGGRLRTRRSLTTVCRDLPKGRFIAIKRGHALAVIDGQVMDFNQTGGRAQITHLYLFEPIA